MRLLAFCLLSWSFATPFCNLFIGNDRRSEAYPSDMLRCTLILVVPKHMTLKVLLFSLGGNAHLLDWSW
jgi:hypothetical protein